MTAIAALIFILWVWGGAETFATCTGHGKWPKIDFILTEYFAVARYPRAGRNCEMRFQTAKVERGLHKYDYQLQTQNLINREFCC